MRALDRRWRQFATGLCFVVFGVVGVVCGLTIFPAACLTTRDPRVAKRRAQWIVWRWFHLFSHLMRVVGVISWEIHGAEKLRRRGQLIIANHPTLIDVVLLIGYIPEVDCIVKEALFRNPFTRFPIRWAGYIGNGSGSGAPPTQLVEDCAATLKAGNSLLIFPEGTRSVPGRPIHIPHGTARIALEAGVPVLPVTIRCEPIMLSKHVPWHRVPERPGHYRIEVGEPADVRHYLREAPNTAIAARRLSQDWMRYFEQRRGEAPGAPAGTLPAAPVA
ncbi:lysophospholipid acyltransferase family protein [Fontimonas sp. SYSU GA230001]|uniref:lysophospholipid acyltransferase family protein n=1 Tax=Fontimonas sp. SYSU GA230001 TaxID=3142450 RepID=UPI0032B40889